jgi:hypothetical protein
MKNDFIHVFSFQYYILSQEQGKNYFSDNTLAILILDF